MRTRKLVKDENNKIHLVWFGSYGKNQNGTAKFAGTVDVSKPYGYEDNGKHENYSTLAEGIRDDLIQRLSLIKGELWYNIKLGIPLFNKIKKKGLIDSYIIKEVLSCPDVTNIVKFKSYVQNDRNYSCEILVNTTYGEIKFSI